MSDERRYSRDEVALVLRQVAQRSPALSGGDGSHSEGLTRAELQEVVREVGLDVSQVDVALAELETRYKTDAKLFGLQQYVVVQRRIAGHFDAARLQRANKLINRSVGTIGKSELDEEGLSWFGRHVAVTISQEGEDVAIQLEERFHNTVRTQFMLTAMFSLMGGMAALVGLANAGWESLGFVVAGALQGLSYGLLRAAHRKRVGGTQARLELLGDQLVRALGEGGGGVDGDGEVDEVKALVEGGVLE